MKGIFSILLVFFSLVKFSAIGQVLLNNGANINAIGGAYIHVNGSVKNNIGTVNIESIGGLPAEIYVTEDVINNSDLIVEGHIRLLGDWYNNSIFTSNIGTVFLQGANQLISGTVETNFFNLTLDGSGLKTQEINAYSNGILDLKHLELQTEVFSFYIENTAVNSVQRTSGFVSSLNGGFLSRRTEQLDTYLFPVGSSVGTMRYRPVELRPTVSPNNTFEVRMANLDATLEGFDRTQLDTSICELNPLFYHQINRPNGSSSVDLNIFYNELEDGAWAGISNWKQTNVQWEYIPGSESAAAAPLSYAYSNEWNDFDDAPYILAHINENPIFDSIPPVCQNDLAPVLPNISLNGFSGTWSGSIDSGLTGTQTFTFTPDPNQCAQSTVLSVEVMELPQIEGILMTQEIACYGGEGIIEIQSTASNMMYGINGNEMVSSNQFTVLSGMHTISIMNEYGCSSSMNQEITEPAGIVMQASVENILCPEGTGSIDLEISGGTPAYAVVWEDELFQEDISELAAGNYFCVVTDDNDCQDSITVEVIETLSGEPAFISNNTGLTQLTCLTTEIEVEAFGGTNFTWSGGTSTNTALNNITEPGNYFVDYLDSNGCELQMNLVISQDITPPVVSIDNITNMSNELNCDQPEITLFGSGSDSYVWEDTINNISTTVSSPGEYQVVGVGWNGCTDSATIVITSDFAIPSIFIQNLSGTDTLDCNTTSIDLEVNGALNYEWANGMGSSASITVLTGGMYTVTGIGANGCTNIDSLEIIEIPFPTLSVNSETICSGNTIELIAVASIPGGVFTWSDGLGNSSSVTVDPISNAFYTVDYELNGCESNTATSTIFVLPTPVVSIAGPSAICSSQSITLTGSPSLPGGTYEWFPGGEVSNSITSFPPASTVYGLSYTLDGCPSDTAEINVEVIPTPIVTLQDISICEGESGTLTAEPSVLGGTYNWVPFGYATQSITESPDTTTSYSVLYSANGCISQLTTATIFVNPIPELTVEDIGICQGESGFLTAEASILGGDYNWTGYSENTSILEVNPMFSSNYTVSYELNDCVSSIETALVTVTEQPVLSFSDQGICEGESISLSATPSALGGSYTWLPGNETSASINVSPTVTSDYQVMYELNGCETDYETITVIVDPMPVTTFDVNVTSGCPPLNVVFTNTTDNASGCTWTINNGSSFDGCTNSSYTFWDEGCYDVTLITETPNGCPGIMTMDSLICVLPSPNIDFSVSSNQISYGSSEVMFINNSTNAVDYFWDFGDGNNDSIYNPNAYEYELNDETFFIVTLNGTTDLGCTDSLQLEIFVNQNAIIFAPNTFTPDGDGLNDSWFPTISNGIDEDFFGVQIYNRWGEMIFEAKDFYSAWDGTYQGNKVPIGTYTYRINYKEKQTEQREVIVGHVSLVR